MLVLIPNNVKMGLFTPQRKLVRSWTARNLIVSVGEILLARLIMEEAVTAPTHMAIGDGAVVSTSAMTALQGTEHLRSVVIPSRSDATILYTASFTATSTVTVREAGIFNAASAGTMLARWLTTEFVFPSTYTFQAEWSARIAGIGA